MSWFKKFTTGIGDTIKVVVGGTVDEVTNWFDGKDDEFGQGWQTQASQTDTYGDFVIDSDGDGRVDAWDLDKDGMTKEQATQAAFEPTKLEQQYADMQQDEFNYWKDNYLPLYQEAADAYRGKDFAEMRERSHDATDRQFGAMKTSAENTAKSFGVNADIDSRKWDAMKAKTKAGTNQEYKLNFEPSGLGAISKVGVKDDLMLGFKQPTPADTLPIESKMMANQNKLLSPKEIGS